MKPTMLTNLQLLAAAMLKSVTLARRSNDMPTSIRTYRPGRVRSSLAKHRSQRQRRRDHRRQGVRRCRVSGRLRPR